MLITGIQALPNPANRVTLSPAQSRKFQNETRKIYPRTESSLDKSQIFQGNTTSLATEPILYHEKTTFLTPPIIITLVLFLTFAASIIAIFFYGHEIRSFFLEKLRRQKVEEPMVEKSALGFGFDGLTEAEMEAHKWREEREATLKKPFWHIKLPTKAPVLVLEPSISPPISLDDSKILLEDSKADEKRTGVEVHTLVGCESLRRASDPSAIVVVDR